jgi:hypothetical protein
MNGNARWTGSMLAALLLIGDARAAAPGGIVVDVTPAPGKTLRAATMSS